MTRLREQLPLFRPRAADCETAREAPSTRDRVLDTAKPKITHEQETDSIELFYDLFFLANLVVFTNAHDVNDAHTLGQYAGFFALLWLTWYQVGLYDARFCMDSVIERILKAFQFAAMIAFSAAGPQFNSGEIANEYGTIIGGDPYRAITLILMASRLVLFFQYLQTICFTWQHKDTKIPLLVLAGLYAFTALVYFALYWSFKLNDPVKNWSWVAWYVLGAFETFMATAVSALWRLRTIKDTSVVQRMGMLTLVILGLGVIQLAIQCQAIAKSSVFSFEGSVVGSIAAAMLILYFMYLIYFDWTEEQPFGSGRQLTWSLIHFPLHMFLALAVQGLAWNVIWRAAVVRVRQLDKFYEDFWSSVDTPGADLTSQSFQDFANDLGNRSIENLMSQFNYSNNPANTIRTVSYIEAVGDSIPRIANYLDDKNASLEAATLIQKINWATVFAIAGYGQKNLTIKQELLNSDNISNVTRLFEVPDKDIGEYSLNQWVTFVFFFVSLGIVVILCTIIAALSKMNRKNHRLHWIRLAISAAIGAFLCLFVLLALNIPNNKDYSRFIFSPWVLPIACVSLFAVVLLNNVKPVLPKLNRNGRRGSGSSGSSDADHHATEHPHPDASTGLLAGNEKQSGIEPSAYNTQNDKVRRENEQPFAIREV